MKRTTKRILCVVMAVVTTALFCLSPVKNSVSFSTKSNVKETTVPEKTETQTVVCTPSPAAAKSVTANEERPFTASSSIKKTVTSAEPLMADNATGETSYDIGPDAEYHKPLHGFADMIYNEAVPVIEEVYNGKSDYAITDFIDIASVFTEEEMDSLTYQTHYLEGKELTERDVGVV